MSNKLTLNTFINTDPGTAGNPPPPSPTGNANLWLIEEGGLYFAEGITVQIFDRRSGSLDKILTQANRVFFEFYSITDPVNVRALYKALIDTRQKVPSQEVEYYYIKFTERVQVGLPPLIGNLEPINTPVKIFFEPSVNEKFLNSNFNVTAGNVEAIRRSRIRLIVDNTTLLTPNGEFISSFLPGNIETLLRATDYEVRSRLPRRLFSRVQDSLYYDTAWKNGRYDGSQPSRIRAVLQETAPPCTNCRVIGDEPALSFVSEIGAVFSDVSDPVTIEEIFSNSIAETENIEIFYVNYTDRLTSGALGSDSEFVPDTRTGSNVFEKQAPFADGEAVSVLYSREDGALKKIVSSKVYFIGIGKVYRTDENGIVVEEFSE